jgi:hypothetical protein
MAVTPLSFQSFVDTTDSEQLWLIYNALTSGSSGGVTIADGADVAQGSKSDTAWNGSGSATEISLQKAIYNALITSLPSGTNPIGYLAVPSALINGQATSSGSATALASNAVTTGVVITNTGATNAVYIGNSGLTAGNGYSLAAGASVGLVVSNTNLIYILQNTGSTTVSFIGS